MMIFRILCGEWIEPLWDCMRIQKRVVSIILKMEMLLTILIIFGDNDYDDE